MHSASSMHARRRTVGLAVWILTAAAAGAAIYEVPENNDNFVGARDANILADDVHFETASIVKLVRIRLAIRGTQTCKLWLFDALNSPALHVATFTNVPATDGTDVSTYDFPMHLQVPKDIYVGFSAQGDGWTNGADYWSLGDAVNAGVAGTPGGYYYGTVVGEQLTDIFNIVYATYGCMQILSEPVRIDAAGVATGFVNLAIAELPIHATNAVERIASLGATNWTEVEKLPQGASNHLWSVPAGTATAAFYRVTSR